MEAEEPGFLEVLAEGEAATEHVGGVLSNMQAHFVAVGEMVREASSAMPTSFAGRLQLARQLAASLAPEADGFEAVTNELYQDVNSMDSMLQWVFERLSSGEESVDDSRGYLESIVRGLVQVAVTVSV